MRACESRGAASALRGRGHRRRAAPRARHHALLSGPDAASGCGAVRRLASRCAGRRECVCAQDGIRRMVEGKHRAATRRSATWRARTSTSRTNGAAPRPTLAERLPQAERVRRRKGLALGGRDGGDRRHVRGGRPARRRSTAPPPGCTGRDQRHAASPSATATAGLRPASTSSSSAAGSCSSPGRTARARRRCSGCSPGSSADSRRASSCLDAAHGRLPRPRAARLPGAVAAREPELFGRLYRVPERGERIGMLLERFGLWEVRTRARRRRSPAGCSSGSGSAASLLHEPALLVLDEPFNALDAQGAELLDSVLRGAVLDERAPGSSRRTSRRRVERRATERLASHDVLLRRRRARAQGPAARAAGEGDGAVDAALRDRRADDLPFRAADAATSHHGGARPALDGAGLHGAARADAGLRRPSGSRGCSTRSCWRPATAARSGSARRWRCSPSSSRPRSIALPAFAVFFPGLGGRTVAAVVLADIGIAPSARSSARWRSPAGRASCCCRCSSCRWRSRSSWAGRASVGRRKYLWFLVLYDAIFACSSWAAFEYVVSET